MKTRFIYVVGVDDKPVKIGSARNVDARVKELQIGCPAKLNVYLTVDAGFDVARSIEMRAHGILKEHRLHGEWFDVDVEQAKAAIIKASESVMPDEIRIRLNDDDPLVWLEAEYELHPWAKEAVREYRGLCSANGRKRAVAKIDAMIVKQSSITALSVLRVVALERKDLAKVLKNEQQFDRAKHLLQKAVNELAKIYVANGRVLSVDQKLGIVA